MALGVCVYKSYYERSKSLTGHRYVQYGTLYSLLYIVGTYSCTIYEVRRKRKEEKKQTVSILRLGALRPE